MKVTSLFSYMKPYAGRSAVGALFKLFEAILELYMPMVLIKVIDNGIATGDREYVVKMCFVLIGIVFTGLCCALICQYTASKVSQGCGTSLRNAVFDKILGMSRAQTDKFGAASLVNRVTTDVNNLQYFIAMLIRLVIRAPFLCIGGVVMAFVIDARLALIVVGVIPIFVFFLAFIMKKTIPMHGNVQKKLDSLTGVLRETVSGVRVIRAFARSSDEQKRFAAATEAHAEANYTVSKFALPLNPITTLIMNLAVIAVLWVGGYEANTSGGITAGEITAFINYISQILAALVVVANLVITFSKTYSSALRIVAVMSVPEELPDGGKDADFVSGSPAVEFRNVTFAYPDGAAGIADVSFKVDKGMSAGIIGGTGSGKSTLVNLIPRFFDVTSGQVLVGGQDVRKLKKTSLREKISVVPQKTELISGTIEDNIIFGSDVGREAAEAAAAAACASDFISQKPNGISSAVEQNGANFSGGQKQRLSIARALAKPSDILILDDSSSALDYATDAQVRHNIKKLYPGKTVFSVSQRVGSIKDSDVILVLDEGRLAGCGTHAELIGSCAVYREICASQGVTE